MPMVKRSVEGRVRQWKNQSRIEGECWIWEGAKDSSGYGICTWNGRHIGLHRVSAFIFLGLDENSPLKALHKLECPNKTCWNPDHLYIGTQADNMSDAIKAGTFHAWGHKCQH